MRELRIHMDTLEYSRSGLSTPVPLDVKVGNHHRVVLVRPRRQLSPAASYGGFAKAVSFPGPAVLSLLHHTHVSGKAPGRVSDRPIGSKLQLFAHTDAVGTDSDNKGLADRRAKATHALMTRNASALIEIFTAEAWPPELGQVMLRCLGHDPGPIDGKFEELTSAATLAFQESYVGRSFHGDQDPLVHPELSIDGELGPSTMEALIDAYVAMWSPRIPEEDFLDHNPVAGCGAYNGAFESREDPANRRVSLVVHSEPLEYPEAASCREGDPMACPVVDDAAHRCMWFREHVSETPQSRAAFHHFEPSWLRLPNGAYLLSALTTVADGDSVTFEVFRSHSLVGPSGPADVTQLGSVLMDSVSVSPVHGVAQVVWLPTEGHAALGLEEPAFDDQGQETQVPTFRLTHVRSGSRLHAPVSRPRVVVLFRSRPGRRTGSEELELELVAGAHSVRTPASAARPYTEAYDAVSFCDFGDAREIDLAVRQGDGPARRLLVGVPLEELQRIESSPDLLPSPPRPSPVPLTAPPTDPESPKLQPAVIL